MPIEISDYRPDWDAEAQRAIVEVLDKLPGRVSVVEHVGSTAVPGLAAKPVIDLMASTPTLDAVLEAEAALIEIGYQRIETGMPGRLFYQRAGHHLHVVTEDTWATRNERLLRDHLLANPADRDQYAQLKLDLAATGADGDAYTRGKTALIQRMVDDARAARGLPQVDVWED